VNSSVLLKRLANGFFAAQRRGHYPTWVKSRRILGLQTTHNNSLDLDRSRATLQRITGTAHY